MKQFVKTTNYKFIDTKQMIPHLECYIIKEDNHLYAEQINGSMIDLGKIIAETDSLEEIDYKMKK